MRKWVVFLGSIILWAIVFPKQHPLGLAKVPRRDCSALKTWVLGLENRFQAAVSGRPVPPEALPLPKGVPGESEGSPRVWEHVTWNVLEWTGWPKDVAFAKYRNNSLLQVLSSPALQRGAFLIVIPGHVTPLRRSPTAPWIVHHDNAIKLLPLASIETLAAALENHILGGRKLFRFSLETTELPLCLHQGACAVWEGSSGRVLVDKYLMNLIMGAESRIKVLESFASLFASKVVAGWNASSEAAQGGQDLVGKRSPSGNMSLGDSIDSIMAFAADAAVLDVFGKALPFWWCLTCPMVLGFLAPFIFNYGLTAAADELCIALQLSDQECADMWWSSFALALILSLGAAIPIVYVCHLPDCIKRTGEGD